MKKMILCLFFATLTVACAGSSDVNRAVVREESLSAAAGSKAVAAPTPFCTTNSLVNYKKTPMTEANVMNACSRALVRALPGLWNCSYVSPTLPVPICKSSTDSWFAYNCRPFIVGSNVTMCDFVKGGIGGTKSGTCLMQLHNNPNSPPTWSSQLALNSGTTLYTADAGCTLKQP